jgi:phospholipid transport system substrate-binding protein
MKKTLLLLSLSISLILLSTGAQAQASPMAFLKKTQARLNRLAKAKAADTKLKKEVNKLLDFTLMSKRTLRKHWSTLDAAKRVEFTQAFQSLLEKKYIKGLRKKADYTVVYKKQSRSGSMAKVTTEVNYVRKGRQRSNEIVYRLRRVGSRWVIFDVITDDVSMEKNYRRSFNRLIRKKGFDVLVKKLKKKAARM